MTGLDVAPYGSLTPEAVRAAARRAREATEARLAAIVAQPREQRDFERTVLAYDEALEPAVEAANALGFLAYVAPEAELREAGRAVEVELERFLLGLHFRDDLYEALRDAASHPRSAGLAPLERRLLEHTLRDFRRAGADLPPDRREELRRTLERLVELGTEFQRAIDEWDDAIEVPEEELTGLPAEFRSRLQRRDTAAGPRYRVSLQYPELYPFLSHAESERARKELFLKEQRRGGPENVRRLEEALSLRARAARLLGYDCWASYVLEVRMAKDRETVSSFLLRLRERIEPKLRRDLDEMRAAKRARFGSEEVEAWDWRFYQQQLVEERFHVDEFAVAEYFPLDAVVDGLLRTTARLFSLHFEPVRDPPRWHEDVFALDVYDSSGGPAIGRIYFDLHPRPQKYGHAAAFTLRRGRRLPDGSYQRPVSAIVANFTKPTDERPALLRHSEVVTLFHEFGHILHQVLTRSPYGRFAGTNVERDFVEAPSQMLEHWCWEPEGLSAISRHVARGEPLPPELIERMVRAKHVGSGVATARQIFFALLDIAYHSPDFDGDSTATLRRLYPVTGFRYPEGTHFQSGFGHLFGYDAGYYGYLWSKVFGDDMFERFREGRLFDAELGRRFRELVYETGGCRDGGETVRAFLEREPSEEPFLRDIGAIA